MKTACSHKDLKNIFYVFSGIALEYFDVMLYVHLGAAVATALFLNESPLMAKAGYTFAFLSTVVFRPIGAFIWGHVGDKFGRKVCVTVTPIVVGVSCFTMLLIPNYREVGAASIWMVFALRALQGLAWTGEKTAANVYVTEMVPFPKAGFYSSLAGAMEDVGAIFALLLISTFLWLDPENGWRYPFMVGGCVALLSIPFRRKIEESSEYMEAQVEREIVYEVMRSFKSLFVNFRKTLMKFCIIETLFGAGFFFVYIYCGEVLSKQCHLSAASVASHNMLVGFAQMSFTIGYGLMSLKWDGLKIVQYRVLIYIACIPLIFWYFLTGEMTETKVYITQILICFLGMDHIPCLPHLIKPLPVLFRMRGFGIALSIGKVIMYIITTFCLLGMVEEYGQICIPILFFMVACAVGWALWTYPRLPSEGEKFMKSIIE